MRPVDVQIIGDELALKWDEGGESFIKLETLRRYCPCAGCKGEVDILGQLAKGPDRPLTPTAFRVVRVTTVGGYGLQPLWADGHGSGIFSFEELRRLGTAAN